MFVEESGLRCLIFTTNPETINKIKNLQIKGNFICEAEVYLIYKSFGNESYCL